MNLTQQRYQGYYNTPFLWKEKLLNLQQFNFEESNSKIATKIPDTIRLGNYVEQLVFYQLEQDENLQLLTKNKQVFSNKITLGEIDCLLLQGNQPIHLEIAYKFYLYDVSVGNTFLEHWIGPNRRDSLLLKLKKVKEKQFPLLYSKECKDLLEQLELDINSIQQKTFFKAQLYVPYQNEINFEHLNNQCVQGFYVNSHQLKEFSDCKFYIPIKLDWIIEPHSNVSWLSFEDSSKRILEFHEQKSAPLCWMKKPNGQIHKLCIVWW